MPDTQGLFSAISDKLPKHWSLILSAVLAIGTLGGNYAIQKTHLADQLAEQGSRITTLESIVKDDLATRRELDQVQTTLQRVEDKLDSALQKR
jgi:hypothetical protein